MYLIDKKGVRPVCVACKKATKEYGVVVPEGKGFVCQPCRDEAIARCAWLNRRVRKSV